MIRKLFFVAGFALCCSLGWANSLTPEVLSLADAGVRAVYALDFDTARQNIDTLLKKYPNYPLALFGRTMIEWSRFEYEFEKSNPAQAEIFEESISSSIEGIKQWLKDNGDEAQAYMALGGVYGVKARFELANKSYIKAYFSGRKGLKYMNKATKLDPEMYDAYLGEAIYQYYAGTLPAVVKVLAKLVVSGDAQKGIDYLNMIKEKGRFSADTAKLLLVEISIESDKYYNPPLADKYIHEILEKYPNNPLYNFVAIIASYENKDYDNVYKQASDFLNNIGVKPFYKEIYIARSYTAMGTALMAKGEYEEAAKVFEQSRQATKEQEMSRWQLYNEFRLAQCYDAQGRRDLSEPLYKDIIARKQNWDIDEVAKAHLKEPFKPGTELGRMSPP